ncbi:hypothetical protein LINGRAHAP2_LOCUS26166 [Linum grandiflorum]
MRHLSGGIRGGRPPPVGRRVLPRVPPRMHRPLAPVS